ncbi:hypothetical protein H4R33_003231 [Dimargaris cristalligena]|nr:hypothetical protein H4R33_003231 [Dimargaris cristalligena]
MFRGREGRESRPTTPSGQHIYEPTLPMLPSIAGVPSNKISSRARVNKANIIGPSSQGYHPTPLYPRELSPLDAYTLDNSSQVSRASQWATNSATTPLAPSRSSSEFSNGSYATRPYEPAPYTPSHVPTSYSRFAPSRVGYGSQDSHRPTLEAPHVLSHASSEAIYSVRHRPLPPSPFSQAPFSSSPNQLSPLEQVMASEGATPRPRVASMAAIPSVEFSPTHPFPTLPRSPTSVLDLAPPSYDLTSYGSDSSPESPEFRHRSISKVFSEDGSRPVPTGPNARILKPRPETAFSHSSYALSHVSGGEADVLSEEWGPGREHRAGSHISDTNGNSAPNDQAHEARSNRKLEDLKITNESLLTVNRMYEDKIRTQRQRIVTLEQQLGIRPSGPDQSTDDPDFPSGSAEGDLMETDGSTNELQDEASLLAHDPLFQAIIVRIELMIQTGKQAITYTPGFNAGKVLSHSEVLQLEAEKNVDPSSSGTVVDQSVLDLINDDDEPDKNPPRADTPVDQSSDDEASDSEPSPARESVSFTLTTPLSSPRSEVPLDQPPTPLADDSTNLDPFVSPRLLSQRPRNGLAVTSNHEAPNMPRTRGRPTDARPPPSSRAGVRGTPARNSSFTATNGSQTSPAPGSSRRPLRSTPSAGALGGMAAADPSEPARINPSLTTTPRSAAPTSRRPGITPSSNKLAAVSNTRPDRMRPPSRSQTPIHSVTRSQRSYSTSRNPA